MSVLLGADQGVFASRISLLTSSMPGTRPATLTVPGYEQLGSVPNVAVTAAGLISSLLGGLVVLRSPLVAALRSE